MKATLEFDLDDHSDKLSHKRAVSATDAYLVFHDLFQTLRMKIKQANHMGFKNIDFGGQLYSVEQLEGIQEFIQAGLNERDINMDDLE